MGEKIFKIKMKVQVLVYIKDKKDLAQENDVVSATDSISTSLSRRTRGKCVLLNTI